jgi:proteic killer suppression protein
MSCFFWLCGEDIYNRVNWQEVRRTCPEQIYGVVRRKLDQLNAVVTLGSLHIPRGNELEALRGIRAGQHSIRINDQVRISFVMKGQSVLRERTIIRDRELGIRPSLCRT